MISAELQPDQRPDMWDDHVCVYETVFEPFTMGFAARAVAGLSLRQQDHIRRRSGERRRRDRACGARIQRYCH